MNRRFEEELIRKNMSSRRWVAVWFMTVILILLSVKKGYAFGPDLMDNRSGMSVRLFDSKNGMSTSEANDIIQTPDGFIYIASYSGLFRHDGRSFMRIGAEYGVNSCVALYVDSQERLWVGTNDGGVMVYDNGVFEKYTVEDGLHSNTIRAIVEDASGNILIATTSGLAWLDPSGKIHSSRHPNLRSAYVESLFRSGDMVYGHTMDGSIFAFKDGQVTSYFGGDTFDKESVNCIYPDEAVPGAMYIGMADGQVLYGSAENGFQNARKVNCQSIGQINGLRRCGEIFFVVGAKGIGSIDANYIFHEIVGLPMNNSIKHVMQDYEGNFWFTSTRQGVMEIMQNNFTDVFAMARLGKDVVNATCIDHGMLYIGTDDGLIVLDSQYHQVTTDISRYLESIRIRSIVKDSKGNIWFATFGDHGLVKLSRDGEITEYGESYGISNRVRTVEELSDGRIAVSAGGVVVLRDDKVERHYRMSNEISNAEILTICSKQDGGMYLGTDGDGIYEVHENGSVTHIGLNDGLISGVVLRVKYDVESKLYWIVTSNSLGYIKDDRVITIKNFPNFNNFDLFPDSNGNIWVLSSNGVYVVRKDELVRDVKNMANILYTINTGLPCVATANSRSELTKGGDLYIAGTTGVALVNINRSLGDDISIKTAIPSVYADDQQIFVNKKGEVTIPASAKRLTIDAYALTYALKDPEVSYQLEGFDRDSFNTTRGKLDSVSYTNLPGRSYTFHFALVDALTGQYVSETALRIHKEKKIHEQLWFRVFMGLLVLGIMVATTLGAQKHAEHKASIKAKQEADLRNQIISAFAKCIDYKDQYTKGHSFRVADYAVMIAKEMNIFNEKQLEEIQNIALLHDIGKISIPDAILNKPGKLTDEEYEIMKTHAVNGAEILKEIRMMPDLANGAMYHHKHYDGGGYPERVTDVNSIPMVAQIVAVADSFDAMYSTRVYRKKMQLEDAIVELEKRRGTWYNPVIVDAFLKILKSGTFVESHAGEE